MASRPPKNRDTTRRAVPAEARSLDIINDSKQPLKKGVEVERISYMQCLESEMLSIIMLRTVIVSKYASCPSLMIIREGGYTTNPLKDSPPSFAYFNMVSAVFFLNKLKGELKLKLESDETETELFSFSFLN